MESKSLLDQKTGNAWSTYRSGQHAAAIKAFEEVLAQSNTHIDALYGLGLVLRTSGDLNGARTRWEKALKIANDHLEQLGTLHSGERERAFMTATMLKQRLAEIKVL